MANRSPAILVSGIPMISVFVENWENVQRFQAREDDLLINTYPKSGTTWMSEIMDLILCGGDTEKTKRAAIFERVPFLEYAVPDMPTGTEILNGLKSRRLIKSHLPVQLLPASFWEKNCKAHHLPNRQLFVISESTYQSCPQETNLVYLRDGADDQCSKEFIRLFLQNLEYLMIYVARNPKDVLVSYYHFHQMAIVHPDPGTFEEYLQEFINGTVCIGSWSHHVKGWWKKRHQRNILYLFYEDLLEDPKREIRKVIKFMEKDLPEDVIEKIHQSTTFKAMKENKMTNYSSIPTSVMDHTISPFMRKGICGDWKNQLTVAQNELLDEYYKKEMSDTDLSFRF